MEEKRNGGIEDEKEKASLLNSRLVSSRLLKLLKNASSAFYQI